MFYTEGPFRKERSKLAALYKQELINVIKMSTTEKRRTTKQLNRIIFNIRNLGNLMKKYFKNLLINAHLFTPSAAFMVMCYDR